MKKRFATVFNDFELVHLYKDVGMIPSGFTKLSDYKKSIIFFWDKIGNKKVENLELIKIIPIASKSRLIYYAKLIYLIKKYSVTDLNLYHDSLQSSLFCYISRFINLRSYLKLDLSEDGLEILKKKKSSKRIIDKLSLFGLNLATFISVETDDMYQKLIRGKVFNKEKIAKLPNAVLKEYVFFNPVKYKERKNKILVVGRIGAHQKNHELILKAIIDDPSFLEFWEINFIGKIEKEFINVIEDFERNNIIGKNRITFSGEKNRKEIMKEYSTSKVFLLSSRYEGFSLALVEAAYFGCYIVTTDVGGAWESTCQGKLGIIYKEKDLSKVLLSLNDSEIEHFYEERLKYGSDTFALENYIDMIHDGINNV